MSDLELKILDLIEKKYTINEILKELNISREQLCKIFREMKKIGMTFSKKYYSSGDIIYALNKEIYLPPKNSHVNIITEPGSDSFRALLIADLHLGSEFECISALEKAYNYCINNHIHIIIIAGDFLDGISLGCPVCKKHVHPLKQMEHALNNYPFDKNILNFLILGNHDIDSLSTFGIDFSEYLKNFRYDIVPIGYGSGFINIKNDRILLSHPLCVGVSLEHDLTSNFLLIKGHQHISKAIMGINGNCSLSVPSLSNLFLSENEFLPGAVDLSIKFKGGFFDTVYYEHLLFGDKIHAISSTQYAVSHAKERNFDGPIKYEEKLSKRKTRKK